MGLTARRLAIDAAVSKGSCAKCCRKKVASRCSEAVNFFQSFLMTLSMVSMAGSVKCDFSIILYIRRNTYTIQRRQVFLARGIIMKTVHWRRAAGLTRA